MNTRKKRILEASYKCDKCFDNKEIFNGENFVQCTHCAENNSEEKSIIIDNKDPNEYWNKLDKDKVETPASIYPKSTEEDNDMWDNYHMYGG